MTEQNLVDKDRLSDFYQRLMRINQEAFTFEQFDVAYHSLQAALHCAQTLKDIQGLMEVERAASEQLSWIDAHHPEYEHSTHGPRQMKYAYLGS